MADFATRFEEILMKHIGNTVEQKGEHLVINRQMSDNDVHWHRGYIAAYRDLAVFISKELKKQLNEG